MREIIIYGAGNRGKNLYEFIKIANIDIEVVAIIDGNSQKWGEVFCDDIRISATDILKEYRDVPICITIYNSSILQQVRRKLKEEYGYDLTKEVEYEEILWSIFENLSIKEQNLCFNREKQQVIFSSYMGLGLGGIEAWTKDVCTGLWEYGWKNIRILIDQEKYEISYPLESIVDVVERVDKGETEDRYENFQRLVEYYVKNLPCVIVTSRCNVELMAAATVKKWYPDKVKIVSVIHMGTMDTYRKYSVYKKYVDLYIGVAQDIKEGMLEQGIERVTSMVCPFVCEKEITRSYTLDTSLPICVGYAGRLDSMIPAQKRVDLLLKLTEELLERKINFKFEIAGDGPAKSEMEDWVSARGCQDKVVFWGKQSREQIPSFWKRQDICINLADFEGRSISIIEAMGNGAVPVVTLVSGIGEDIVNGVNGYTVPVGEYKLAVDKIEYLSKKREKLQEMGKRAHEMIYPKSLYEKHFEFWDMILKETFNM